MAGDYFYADNGAVVGPITLEDAKRRMAMANGPHFVWTSGMADWTDARNLSEFSDFYRPPTLPELDAAPVVLRTSAPHPWRRYFARMLDIYLFFLVAKLFFGIMFPSAFGVSSTSSQGDDGFLGLVSLLLYIPIEAFILHSFGTTLGKFIYGIGLAPRGDSGYLRLLHRSVLVWWRGLGTGFPLISLFTLFHAYSNLRKFGISSWDEDLGFRVSHSNLSVTRWLGIVIIWLCMLYIFAEFTGWYKMVDHRTMTRAFPCDRCH